ncbi:putative multi-sensor signal transduction histidine kinase [Actinoplanes missouriensis 431]|uniref:histidine kinase n=1 Tax=Actinoplanes missouriensis (strain ATCC 14538 / DSM 43046 / CBS 188.64 / JCM 3121 / NBRC 102363 / NCIMB 12654 / NRRL B-3342 / UNCC 431) TaxID=512565 RepID=I0H7C1_ACTM4|nr:PAS domain S-box protein [Actinoplanes missouriensis]BAL88908.1 putative multi-sensor signal transduction histidine kinase [Actinoplanes missouriensis 431]
MEFREIPGLLLDTAPDAIVVSRSDGTITLANRRAHDMFGYPAGELVGRAVDDLVPEDARSRHPARRSAYLAGDHPPLRRLPLRGLRRDGSVFPVEISLSAVTPAGDETYVTSVLRDDTAQREAARTRALLASVVQSSHDAIVTTDLDGVVLSWNPGAEMLYGHPAADMIGRTVDVIIPDERRSDEEQIRMLVRLGGRVDRYRSTRLTAKNEQISVSTLISPLLDERGNMIGTTTITRDISDRERAEARVQAILDAAPDAMLGVAESGEVVLVNAEAERLFDHPRYDLLHMPLPLLLPDGLPPVSAVLRTGSDSTPLDTERAGDTPAEYGDQRWATRRALRRGGAELPVDLACSSLHTDSGVVIVVVVRDITERLAAEQERRRLREEAERQRLEARMQQAQRLESLGQLAGGIAHDFNNLLAVILNYASFIVEDATGTPSAADAEQIARAARRGSDLTHQLLAFARREVIRPRPLNLNVVVTEVHQMLERSLGEHIALTVRTTAGLPSVMADPGQLEQVLVNLAVNARDAMPTGGRLTIDTAPVQVDAEYAARLDLRIGSYVRLRVSDTGTGMPREVIDKAFEPFFTTKPSGQGTGLGLATVYGIITQAGGTVRIYSESGIGTTFTILLPATDMEAREASPEETAEELSGHGAVVLVVEDEAALREVTSRILRRGGYTVLVAGSGEEALRLAAENTVDVLLTDVIMPGMLGRDLASAVHRSSPGTKVLFMSGYAQPVLTTHGTLSADVHLLEKPFTSAELMRALHDELQARP